MEMFEAGYTIEFIAKVSRIVDLETLEILITDNEYHIEILKKLWVLL